MNVIVGSDAKKDLRSVESDIRTEIVERIEGLRDDPTPENSKVIELLDGSEIQCLKLQEEDRNSDLNHRITYDILNDEQIRVYGIFPRKPGYRDIKEKTQERG